MSIKETVNTQGWAEIRMMFEQEIEKLKKDIPYNKKSMEEVGKQYVATQEAGKIIDRLLKKIERQAVDVKVNKQSFK